MLPTQKDGDEGCKFDNGKVTVPESFHKLYKLYREGEWLGMTDNPEFGGQGMPKTVALAASEYFNGANVSFMLFNGMTHGAAKLVESFGTDEQKNIYLAKMLSGQWGGTMLLTEADAGSDVGALTTSAVKNADGTYSITGSKIFISAGEHDMVENIIHPVLARVEGAPEGTKGISLFLVPKFLVNDDGSPGEFNDVVCTGIEEKMGIHGNATCSLTLGGKGGSIGTLLGNENEGMRNMFVMMNEARQLVGLQGFSVSSASYMYSLDYARQRIQGKNMLDPKGDSVPIIQHPDVRRQLMNMKAWVDGMRSLIYYTGNCYDKMVIAQSDEEKQKYNDLIEVLTPFVKGYITDKALEVCSHGIQVHGGYGFIEEYPVAQLFRDSRIFMLYEGTNGIQAMDLLGRKLRMKNGEAFRIFMGEIKKTIDLTRNIPEIKEISAKVEDVFVRVLEISENMVQGAGSKDIMKTYAFAHPFLEASGDFVMAWMLLWRAGIAAPKLVKKAGSSDPETISVKAEKNKDVAFYLGQLKTAEYFINCILPITIGKLDAINAGNGSAVEMPDVSFGG
ncbi:MAG: acyl-CoA dehydrogenase [Desulfobacteraceae bacterium 4572_19]|nr:MAG: acyl-CoA dehydrogenase [Desulfobacteraceae bacterium 4572_19]